MALRRLLLTLLFATTATTSTRPAFAQPAPSPAATVTATGGGTGSTPTAQSEAEALVSQGVALRQQGRDADALELFTKAFDKSPSPRARAQMGLAEQALGMWLRAEADLSAALAATDDWIVRYREPLDSALRTVRGRLGSLEIIASIETIEVLVDGTSLVLGSGTASSGDAAPAPRVARIEAGTRNITVKAAGFHSVSRSVVIPGGGVARERFQLAPMTTDEREGAGTGTPGSASDGSTQRVLGIGFLSGGGLLLLGGIGAQLGRVSVIHAYNNDSLCPGENVPNQPQACADRIASANTWQTLAIVGYGVGGALAIAGGVVFLTAPRAPKSAPPLAGAGALTRAREKAASAYGQTSCSPTLGERGAAFSCFGRF